jgi:hypothetical protein
MDAEHAARAARSLAVEAARLDELADTAELMGDDHTTERLRRRATQRRAEAMALLDDCE